MNVLRSEAAARLAERRQLSIAEIQDIMDNIQITDSLMEDSFALGNTIFVGDFGSDQELLQIIRHEYQHIRKEGIRCGQLNQY